MLENLGLSGFAFSGADVGGFAGTPSPDLLTKWLEIAAFQPIDRDHTEKGTGDQEPWVGRTGTGGDSPALYRGALSIDAISLHACRREFANRIADGSSLVSGVPLCDGTIIIRLMWIQVLWEISPRSRSLDRSSAFS